MIDHIWAISLLAQAAEDAAPPKNGGDLDFGPIWPMFLAIGVLWYFLLLRPQRREKAKRESLINELKKNDRVVTIGGIIGSVANVSQDSKEVTIKVDDNTRIKMLRSSIQTVLSDEDEGDAAKKS